MTLLQLLHALNKELAREETAGAKDVLVDDGNGPPYADVIGVDKPNEDSVVLLVKKFQE